MNKIWLTLLVHIDAFRSDPVAYFQAVVWRVRGLKLRARNRLAALMGRSPRAYDLWIERKEPRIIAQSAEIADCPLPTILPLVDRRESQASISDTLESIRDAGARVDPLLLGEDGTALGMPTINTPAQLAELLDPNGSWICIVPAGDLLAHDALITYARAARASGAWVIYADDDLMVSGRRTTPHFKASWNPELYEHHDFVTGSAIVRATPEMVAGLKENDWIKALVNKALSLALPIHLPAVLHHRASRPRPSAPEKPRNISQMEQPLVSIIVPTRNALSLLRTCVEGVRKTAYPNIELIVLDNESDDRATLDYLQTLRTHGTTVFRVTGPFNFSALNNFAVKRAKGRMLCFLNNDIEVLDKDWLSLLVGSAMREDIGAVGARLLYPDGSVQHAGVVTGIGGGAGHAHRFQRDDDPGYFLRDRLPQRVSAVTAACLVVEKSKFLAVGGFDEDEFPVAFNDVDLCLKLNARGWQSFYEARAVLIHHESKSRGLDSAKENRLRFAAELAALKARWGTDRFRDPYHHPHLSVFCESFYVSL